MKLTRCPQIIYNLRKQRKLICANKKVNSSKLRHEERTLFYFEMVKKKKTTLSTQIEKKIKKMSQGSAKVYKEVTR